MRTASTFLALALAAAPAPTPTALQDPPSATPLRESMEGMKTELKGIATALQAREGSRALEHIAAMQALVLRAKLESPPNLDQVAEAERAAHRVRFRKDLILVLRELATMEEHVLDGDLDRAFASVVDPLHPLRERAHAAFQREE